MKKSNATGIVVITTIEPVIAPGRVAALLEYAATSIVFKLITPALEQVKSRRCRVHYCCNNSTAVWS